MSNDLFQSLEYENSVFFFFLFVCLFVCLFLFCFVLFLNKDLLE